GAGAGLGAAATLAGAGAFGLGGSGTSIRSAPPPRLCRIGSPFCITTTWQNRLLWLPAGETLSVLMWKTRSVVSLVIFLTSVVTLLGRPTSVTWASPGKSTALATLIAMSTS